jgi:hypothetical protein
MCAVPADGFLPSEVSVLGGSNDCIRAFSPESRTIFVPANVFGKGRLLFRWLFLPKINLRKNILWKWHFF